MRQEANCPPGHLKSEVRRHLQGMGFMRCKGRTFGECAKLTMGFWRCVGLNMGHSGDGLKMGKGRSQSALAGTEVGKQKDKGLKGTR